MPGLVEADDDGLYVVKFHGAAQGPRALVAEVIAGELGRALGLPVPEIVLIEIDPALADHEDDPWVRELLVASPGLNVGLDFLPGSLTYSPMADLWMEPAFGADVIWFDSLITNSDRSPRNPNILTWHRRPYLIDHGAALYIHHTWADPDRHALRPVPTILNHILGPVAGPIAEAHDRLAVRATPALIGDIIASVPDVLLAPDSRIGGANGQRAAYARYLELRLRAQRVLADGIDEALRAN